MEILSFNIYNGKLCYVMGMRNFVNIFLVKYDQLCDGCKNWYKYFEVYFFYSKLRILQDMKEMVDENIFLVMYKSIRNFVE